MQIFPFISAFVGWIITLSHLQPKLDPMIGLSLAIKQSKNKVAVLMLKSNFQIVLPKFSLLAKERFQ
jgi:hypothetical protein